MSRDIEDQKRRKSEISQTICYVTDFYDHKSFKKLYYQNNFLSCIIGSFWHLFSNFEIKRLFWNNLPIIEKIQKWTPKNQKFEIRSKLRVQTLIP